MLIVLAVSSAVAVPAFPVTDVWSPVFVQDVLASLDISQAVVNLLVVAVSSISSASNTTTPVCQFTESTAPHPIVSILSYIEFLVGTSKEPFHHAQYTSSGTDMPQEKLAPANLAYSASLLPSNTVQAVVPKFLLKAVFLVKACSASILVLAPLAVVAFVPQLARGSTPVTSEVRSTVWRAVSALVRLAFISVES